MLTYLHEIFVTPTPQVQEIKRWRDTKKLKVLVHGSGYMRKFIILCFSNHVDC